MKPKPSNLEEVADRIIKELSVVKTVGESEGLQYAIKANIVFFVKKYLKSKCDFYLRYRDSPRFFMEKHPEYVEELINKKIYYNNDDYVNLSDFEDWLFKLAFMMPDNQSDEGKTRANEGDYKKAWLELIKIFGGALDGVEWSAEEGLHANKDVRVYREIEEMINEISEKYHIEKIWDSDKNP